MLKSLTLVLLGITNAALCWAAPHGLQAAMPEVKYEYPQAYNMSTASSCGATMTTYNGVPALSNGGDQGTGNCCGGDISTGCAYQCVELVQRYFHEKFGTPKIWSGVAAAKDMCLHHPSNVRVTNSGKPGYGVVFNWSGSKYGHTAIVESIGSGVVNVVEQNASPSGHGSWKLGVVECYLSMA